MGVTHTMAVNYKARAKSAKPQVQSQADSSYGSEREYVCT